MASRLPQLNRTWIARLASTINYRRFSTSLSDVVLNKLKDSYEYKHLVVVIILGSTFS